LNIKAQTITELEALLPPRDARSHKGLNGHALLAVGCARYRGAALLAAKACLRGGSGLTTVVTPTPVWQGFGVLPEAICISTGTEDWDGNACAAAAKELPGKQAVLIGCGVGQGNILPLIYDALAAKLPLVLDADALNQLAEATPPSQRGACPAVLHENVILTPHVGELARLLGCSAAEISADLPGAAAAAAAKFQCVVLAKSAVSYIAFGDICYKSAFGNAGLAKGGSGDVLAGLVTALLAQGLAPFDAARAGAFLLGASADRALAALGVRMLLASDVTDAMIMADVSGDG